MPSSRLIYHQDVAGDVASIPMNLKVRIKKAIEERIGREPLSFGEPLKKGLAGLRKLRVGDTRVVYELHEDKVRIRGIDHRKKVYLLLERRRRRPFREPQPRGRS